MNDRIPIPRPWDSTVGNYDVFFAAVGYERRARHIAETRELNIGKKLAGAFPSQKVLNYESNLRWFENAGYSVTQVKSEDFREWCQTELMNTAKAAKDQFRIAIDVSSFDRERIAIFVDAIRKLEIDLSINVDFLYSMAKFSAPQKGRASNRFVGPVLPGFAGWSVEPEKPPVAIVGLGYEEDKALGAVEHIQAADVWLFIPQSGVEKYGEALQVANQTLMETVGDHRRLSYPVQQPLECFLKLESLTDRLLQSNSPILFPFGPKLFNVCALLVGCLHENVAVWRVSAGSHEKPLDRLPSGDVYGLSVEFKQ